MTIKQKDGVRAFKALQKLNAQETTGSVALQIFKAMNALQSVWDFQLQEEQKILAKHPDFDVMTSSVKITETKDQQAAVDEAIEIDKEISDLGNLDTDIDFEPLKITLESANLKLSGQDIKDLSGFISFE